MNEFGTWISVENELPPPMSEVIVCANRYEMISKKDRLMIERGIRLISYVREYPKGNYFWEVADYYNIIAWMPLPEPYEK